MIHGSVFSFMLSKTNLHCCFSLKVPVLLQLVSFCGMKNYTLTLFLTGHRIFDTKSWKLRHFSELVACDELLYNVVLPGIELEKWMSHHGYIVGIQRSGHLIVLIM